MRRLWAHILIAFTCIVAAFAAFPSLLKGINTDGDYRNRRTFTFQISERKALEESDVYPVEEGTAKEIAKVMEERLIKSGVLSYDISTSGSDIVNVSFSADSDTEYLQITTYLGFSGSFALMNSDPDGEPIVADQFLNGTAYLKTSSVNDYPTLIIPVKTDGEAYKSIIKWAQDNPVTEESDSDDEESTQTAPVYLIYNYVKGDTYKTLTDTNRFDKKILLTFNALSDDTLYYDDNKNSFSQVIGYKDSNENGYADADEVAAAYSQANFLDNLFNASVLNYDIEVIRGGDSTTRVTTSAKVENIFKDTKIVWNSTLTAVVAAIVIVSLLLVVFYRLGAVSVVTSTVVSTFLAFMFMILTGMQYNTLGLVALILVASLSLISGIIYLTKLKEESYRGRTLKKANSEAARKSTLPIVDIHVVTLVVALFIYLLGGAPLHTFSAILLLGSLSSLLVNIFGLRGMMWLVTNTTSLTGRYDVFAIDSDKIPDHMKDEKQKYFGPYAEKDLTKNKKPVMIAALGLFVAAVAGISVMGALNNGNIFKEQSTSVSASEIYVVDTIKVLSDEKSTMTEDDLRNMLADIKLYNTAGETVTFDENDTHATLASYINKISSFETTDSITNEGTTTQYSNKYFVLSLNGIIDGSNVYAKAKNYALGEERDLDYVLSIYFDDINNEYGTTDGINHKSSIALKSVEKMNNSPQPDWKKITLATSIAIAALTLYMLIRYRLSRGLASVFFPFVASAITLALFVLLSLTGLSLPASVSILIPVVTIFTYVFIILFANKEREMVIEDRSKDNSYDHRVELSKRALGISFTSVIATGVVGVYLLINFFGFGPAVNSYIYVASLLGVILTLFLVKEAYVPVANFFYKLFMNINFEPKIKKSKKNSNVPVKQKSAEPEEAIFIGIND